MVREPIRLTEVLDAARVLVGTVAWATVGVALSSVYPLTAVVLVGLVGTAVAARAPRAALALELSALVVAALLIDAAAAPTLLVGVVVLAVAMAIGVVSARKKAT